jgi:hypothetical protein
MGNYLRAARAELAFPGALGVGSRGAGARRIQEWLSLHGLPTTIDGGFGEATGVQLRAFRQRQSLAEADTLDVACWEALVAPLQRVLDAALPDSVRDLPQATLAVARAHLTERPLEVGGPNRGPWVRAYMDGNEGEAWPWCAGFVTFVAAQAADALKLPCPLPRTFSCDTLAVTARQDGRLIGGRADRWSSLGSCQVFLVRKSPNDWVHTGFAFNGREQTFSTIEGNTNDSGSREGFEVAQRVRSLGDKDFIPLA